MSDDVLVREATYADLPAIHALRSAWHEHEIVSGAVRLDADELADRLGPLLLVAEQAGEVVGYVFGVGRRSSEPSTRADYLEIEDLYVVPDHRGSGIGGALLESLLQSAGTLGIKRCQVNAMNRDAEGMERFYLRHGFKNWYTQIYK